MKKSFLTIACFMFAVSLGCSIASAERKLPMDEVRPETPCFLLLQCLQVKLKKS